MGKDPIDTSPKKMHKIAKSTWKDALYNQPPGKWKLKPQWNTASHPREQL